MASTSDFKNGMCFLFKGDIYTIKSFLHVKPGKGPAFVRTKLRNVKTGKIIENTFNSGVKVEDVRIERRKYQHLYPETDGFHFMNSETFEQIFIEKRMIERALKLTDNVQAHAAQLLGIGKSGLRRNA